MSPIRIGIIGCGFAGLMHGIAYEPFIESGDVKLVAACDIDEGSAAKIAKEYDMNTDSCCTNWQDLISRDDVDAVSITLPHYLHAEVAIAAANAGKHVLCEKPMATTLEDCDKMIQAAKDANVKLMIAETYRFMPTMVKIKEILESGKIGDVFFARGCECLNEIPKLIDADTWHGTADKAGGGIWFDAGVHVCSAFRYTLGDVDSVLGGALEHVAIKEKEDDNGIVLMKFKKGAVAEAFLCDTIGSPPFIRFEFYGTEGTILMDTAWDDPVKFFSSKEGENPEEEWETPEVEHLPMPQFYALSFREEVKEFVQSILEDREPQFRGEEGKVAVEMVKMGTLASKLGRAVDINDLYSDAARELGIK
ncbi:MAG TPA: Gfo/Idh/MocA family oxidoreductase [Candidatus Lokiarchaeia archaeon]|nr:Gfo/Idh/MocA family oxidoreductase [Candidatus Lokiarchaeia archaeon]